MRRIGAFHFGTNHAAPLKSLELALQDASDAREAVIVLPEAFNIGVAYRGEGSRNFEPSIVGDLQRLADRFGVAFVAALVVREPGGPVTPHSGVYFIEGSRSALLCFKIGPDDMAGINYTPCTGQADFSNPITYECVSIGALICVDANPTASLAPILMPRLQTVVAASRIICVPAHMATGNFANGKAGHDARLVSPWRDKILILANSKGNGIDSFITDGNGRILEPTVGGPQNRILVHPFTDD